jgi:hypothetical protein
VRIYPGRLPGLLVLCAAIAGCLGDAERGNPLDPLSDNYENAGAVTGFVARLSRPSDGIADATVHLIPLESGVRFETRTTGTEGRFSVPDVPTGRYLLTAEAPGFALEADTVEVALGQTVEETLLLDGIPAVAQTVHTEYIERWFPDFPLYRLVVSATVSDPDGLSDIEGVALVIPDLGFEDTLAVVAGQPGRYSRIFEEDELPAPLFEIIGLPLRVEATDRAGVTGSAQGVQVVRTLQVAPLPTDPTERETVSTTTPTLHWNPVGLSFAFTYRVQLNRVSSDIQVPLQTFDGLPPSQTSLTVPEGLIERGGEYNWTVAVVDAFNNSGRSKEAGFLVSP